jgi:hypothetical protein
VRHLQQQVGQDRVSSEWCTMLIRAVAIQVKRMQRQVHLVKVTQKVASKVMSLFCKHLHKKVVRNARAGACEKARAPGRPPKSRRRWQRSRHREMKEHGQRGVGGRHKRRARANSETRARGKNQRKKALVTIRFSLSTRRNVTSTSSRGHTQHDARACVRFGGRVRGVCVPLECVCGFC